MRKYHRISSASNPRIKTVVRLQDGCNRRKEGLFLIDGFREIIRALDCGVEIFELFLWDEIPDHRQRSWDWNELREKIGSSTEIFLVSRQVLEKIAFGQRREGVIAVGCSRFREWSDLQPPQNPLFAVLEQIEKPGNLGAIFRSADGAGLDGLFLADPRCDLYNPNVIRASLGTVFRTATIIDTAENMIREFQRRNITIVCARCESSFSYTDFDFTQPCAIVLGTEDKGLSSTWNRPGIQGIHLPMRGIADSLNVSNAAAILFYEAQRQRAAGRNGATQRPTGRCGQGCRGY